MQVALTGATGFIGAHVLKNLLAAGHRVRALRRRGRRSPIEDARIEWVEGRLLDTRSLTRLVSGSDAVVHVAGATAGRGRKDFIRTNVAGTRHLAEILARTRPSAHLLYISSLAAREPALSWYAATKREGEEALIARVGKWSILRPPAVYGPDDPALATFWKLLARGWLVRVGPAGARFSLLHVGDLAEGVVRLLARGPVSEILSLDDGKPGGWNWSDLAALAADRRGGRVRTLPLPLSALGLAGRINLIRGRLAGRPSIMLPGKVRELAHPDWVCDNTALRATLDWRPQTRLEDALLTLPGWESRSSDHQTDR